MNSVKYLGLPGLAGNLEFSEKTPPAQLGTRFIWQLRHWLQDLLQHSNDNFLRFCSEAVDLLAEGAQWQSRN